MEAEFTIPFGPASYMDPGNLSCWHLPLQERNLNRTGGLNRLLATSGSLLLLFSNRLTSDLKKLFLQQDNRAAAFFCATEPDGDTLYRVPSFLLKIFSLTFPDLFVHFPDHFTLFKVHFFLVWCFCKRTDSFSQYCTKFNEVFFFFKQGCTKNFKAKISLLEFWKPARTVKTSFQHHFPWLFRKKPKCSFSLTFPWLEKVFQNFQVFHVFQTQWEPCLYLSKFTAERIESGAFMIHNKASSVKRLCQFRVHTAPQTTPPCDRLKSILTWLEGVWYNNNNNDNINMTP